MAARLIVISCLVFTFSIIPSIVFSQDSTGAGSVKVMHKITWERMNLYFDEDFLNIAGKGTDQYYTGGWQVDFFYRRNKRSKNIFDRLLIKLPSSNNIYFYGMFRRIYTPSDISRPEILQNDRPYASVLTLQHGLISVNKNAKECLSTEIGAGAIGPITFGGQLQRAFHKMVGAETPMGWGNQVRNNIVIDYRLNYERQIYSPESHIVLLANMQCEMGSLADHIGAGITLAFGKLNNFLIENKLQAGNSGAGNDKVLVHFFIHPEARIVMYNATLEGGFFSEMDPYVIGKNDLNYIYMQCDYGFVIVYRRIGFSFIQKMRTAEFRTGTIQQVGNLRLTIPL